MNLYSDNSRISAICVCLSVMVHLFLFFPLGKLGSYNFARPVNLPQAVMVDLKTPGEGFNPAIEDVGQERSDTANVEEVAKNSELQDTSGAVTDSTSARVGKRQVQTEAGRDDPELSTGSADAPAPVSLARNESTAMAPRKNVPTYAIQPPLRSAGEFLATEHEKLTYQINMFGLAVGDAELEAKNERGEVRITLKVMSNAALSTLYPVDDVIETRHIGGNFIITKIRQQEGSLRSNRGFTLFLRDRKVFWHNLLTHKSSNETVPTSDVLDLLSGFYYLRGKQLKVGTSELLQVYDSDQYTEIPVQVLRRERVNLPGLRKADTIVVKPQFTTDGIFKRTGDVTIWLTEDESRTPVKVETSIPLGKVTVELLSAETEKAETSVASPPGVRR
ncbi:MAG: DUF3108 domain-containing protein [Geobacter sp.]|nr:MAG: DUF3108 domain-containing protein [Geobacter sp.]